jgi:alpha,alpha-trehalase
MNKRLPLSAYGLVGDTHTAILISKHGAIDWACFPDFDSPAVFAAILDPQAGHFKICPAGVFSSRQYYETGTNVLVTEFSTETGKMRLRDFIPYVPHRKVATEEIHRIVECIDGHLKIRVEFAPRFDYARASHEMRADPHGAIAVADGASITLSAAVPLEVRDGRAEATFTLNLGEETAFVCDWGNMQVHPVQSYQTYRRVSETRKYWRTWIGRLSYQGRYRDAVERSLLTLKLLSYEPTGAIVAAPTTSLPEWIGGTRNWDYRYTWIRDSAFILGAFFRAGYIEEGTSYFDFILQRVFDGTDLKILYDIHGAESAPETELKHLSGYHDSGPVRVGNGASNQKQLDIYGSLLDAAWLYYVHGGVITSIEWHKLTNIVEIVMRTWKEPDSGIWEARSEARHYTYSKVWAWVALDRAVKIAGKLGFTSEIAIWQYEADEIKRNVLASSWNSQLQCFTQYYGSQTIDASLLVMPETGFIDVNDSRFLSTLDRIKSTLGHEKLPLFYRYDTSEFDDGIREPEGRFLLMSFWYIDSLIMQGKLPQARAALEQMIAQATPLGLYSECLDSETDGPERFLGNFPQGFSHLGLVNSVFKLDQMRRILESK